MKILMLNHEFPPVGGGAAPVTFELCKHLVRKGHRVDVVTMHYDALPRFETAEGVNIHRTPAIRKRPNICYTHELATYVPGALIKTLCLARRIKYDIIHCHFIIPGGALAWLVSKLTGIPFLITCHGTDVPGHNPDRFDFVHRLITPAWRFLAKSSAVLTSPSESLRTLIIQNCPGLKVCMIPNGIYTDKFKPEEKTKSILMCSRIFRFKGFQYALQALDGLDSDWHVDIVGEGPYLSELRKLAKTISFKVNFHGWVGKSENRFYEIFNRSAIFVFPSESESFGLVVAEAMAAGCAVILSDIPSLREVIGDAGIYVKPGDIADIRTKLKLLISDNNLRRKLGELAYKRVCSKFDWAVIVNKYIDCYEKVIQSKL